MRRVRGALDRERAFGIPPHPDPLPASGARERTTVASLAPHHLPRHKLTREMNACLERFSPPRCWRSSPPAPPPRRPFRRIISAARPSTSWPARARATATTSIRGCSAQYMGRHIAGNPRFVVQNMPGAGTLRATNFIWEVAPKDGTYFRLGRRRHRDRGTARRQERALRRAPLRLDRLDELGGRAGAVAGDRRRSRPSRT